MGKSLGVFSGEPPPKRQRRRGSPSGLERGYQRTAWRTCENVHIVSIWKIRTFIISLNIHLKRFLLDAHMLSDSRVLGRSIQALSTHESPSRSPTKMAPHRCASGGSPSSYSMPVGLVPPLSPHSPHLAVFFSALLSLAYSTKVAAGAD